MKNISELKDCYGCGVCVAACPVKIIDLIENNDGFYSPHIEKTDKCIECGLCLKVCAFNHDEVATSDFSIDGYAAWSNNSIIRKRCSSGGVGFEIGEYLISKRYKACGVRYNPRTNRAEHFIASTAEEFMPSAGSKYIPSKTIPAFSEINKNDKYFVTGTPCQIDSFRRYIKQLNKEDNFILLDFFCHGVPSLLLWDKYSNEVEKRIGEITFASWRNKSTGWHDSWSMNADFDKESIDWHHSYNLNIREKKHFYASRMSEGDLFYKFFLGNYCLNKCCYKKCKYKMYSSAADIRIGDLWGRKYKNDTKGVNGSLALTPRGVELIKEIASEKCTIVPETLNVVTEGQMKKMPPLPWVRNTVLKKLHSDINLSKIDQKYISMYRLSIIPKRILNKIKRILFKKKSL